MARPGPHIITVITGAIGTINKPRAILLTAEAGGRKSSRHQPSEPSRPAAVPAGQSPRASPTPLAWPWVGMEPGPHAGSDGAPTPRALTQLRDTGSERRGRRTLGVRSGWPPFPGTDLS